MCDYIEKEIVLKKYKKRNYEDCKVFLLCLSVIGGSTDTYFFNRVGFANHDYWLQFVSSFEDMELLSSEDLGHDILSRVVVANQGGGVRKVRPQGILCFCCQPSGSNGYLFNICFARPQF